MYKTILLSCALLIVFLSGCASTPEYQGISFPKSSKSTITFQENSVSTQCSAFAHLLIRTKMASSGEELSQTVKKEAEAKGADLILVGFARELPGEELEETQFDYYGPTYAYNFKRTWLGWKFGFDEWNDAGKLVGLGSNHVNDRENPFTESLLVQAVFLRCAATP